MVASRLTNGKRFRRYLPWEHLAWQHLLLARETSPRTSGARAGPCRLCPSRSLVASCYPRGVELPGPEARLSNFLSWVFPETKRMGKQDVYET